MNTIFISNNMCFPIEVTPSDAKKMSLNDYIIFKNSNDKFKFDTAYFDIDCLDEELYFELKSMIKDGLDIKFFRFSTGSFMKDKVTIYDKTTINTRENELKIKLSNTLAIDNNLVINGFPGQGKTILLDNIKTQLENKDTDILYIEPNEIFNYYISSNTSLDNEESSKSGETTNTNELILLNYLQKEYDEIQDRFKRLEEAKATSIYKLNNI